MGTSHSDKGSSLAPSKPGKLKLDVPKAKQSLEEHAGKRAPEVSDLMAMEAWERAEQILAPYFAGLELTPDPDWSARTKLEFYQSQSSLAEKILARVEGLPVARQRNVDADGRDVLPHLSDLPAAVIQELILAALAGRQASQGEIVDGTAVEVS